MSFDKLMKYSREGALLTEKRIGYIPNDIEIINDLIYISIIRFVSSANGQKAIFVLDKDFKVVDQIGEYDSRLEKYSYTFKPSLAKRGKYLFFLNFYDLNLNIIKTDIKQIYQITFPNDNNKLGDTWKKRRFSEADRIKIKTTFHRFIGVYSFNDDLMLFEYCREKNINNFWLIDFQKRKAFILPNQSMWGNHRQKSQPDLYLDWIAGSYEKGVIGVLDTIDEFNTYKGNYPALKDLSLKTEENPILVFFELDMDKIKNIN